MSEGGRRRRRAGKSEGTETETRRDDDGAAHATKKGALNAVMFVGLQGGEDDDVYEIRALLREKGLSCRWCARTR